MGVHGLTSLLTTAGVLPSTSPPDFVPDDDEGAPAANLLTSPPASEAPPVHDPTDILASLASGYTLSFPPATNDETAEHPHESAALDNDSGITIPSHSTLAIDGDGLVFHLIKLSYRRHRKRILSTAAAEASNSNSNGGGSSGMSASQLELLPTFLPLTLAHEMATAYLEALVSRPQRMRLEIYYDGDEQRMKGHERGRRRRQREEQWDNLRDYVTRGILPVRCGPVGGGRNNGAGGSPAKKGPSKFRSSARRQQRNVQRTPGRDTENAEADAYLQSFPLSRLVGEQIRRSVRSFAQAHPGQVLLVQCDGEADVEVARRSAHDVTGETYAVGFDSDYLIYGNDDEKADCDAAADGSAHDGEVKYIPFHQLDFTKSGELRAATILTRSDVAISTGLPNGQAMIQLSILLGNDYTGPFLHHDDGSKRKAYKKSLRWFREDDHCGGSVYEELPAELDLYDARAVVDHIAERVFEGYSLVSNKKELQLATEFSAELYSFGDVSSFPLRAPGSEAEEDEKGGSGDDDSTSGALGSSVPSLPRGLDLGLAEVASTTMDLSEAVLLPLSVYTTELVAEADDDGLRVHQAHIDAFRIALETVESGDAASSLHPPRRVRWNDLRVLYVLEKCILATIGDDGGSMPCQVFDHLTFLSALESLSFDDYPLDNEVVSKNERAFLEEATIPNRDDEPLERPALPIDEHEEEILEAVRSQRVTIIHGETGCGKSSRVPAMLLRAKPPEPTRRAPEVKMIVSQPRRIAAKSLAERVRSCEPDLADKIALRMGHGLREYETSDTRAWFVTTGYVVRLLANHPEWFVSHSHLIIDEVHERSVDTDILCLLCRRLLANHPTIRVILMSATMAAELYSQYFGSPQPPIHVGARRYPIKEYFVEDLQSLLPLSAKDARHANDVYNDCENKKCHSAPSASHMDKLYHLATQIALSVGSHGSAVLIFVPGMNDIEAITELIENLNRPGINYTCMPIHSDVPFEEQMAAFDPPGQGEVKVVIATNAAESSVTLPDVDHVICLGLCKQIVYNQASHRQMLQPCWISRASATQRAGRTGRVREGNVYRLYSRNCFETYMPPYDAGEMVRIPLDSVILSLRDMLGEEVTPILFDCLEPPDISTIERSFASLHSSNFISEASDQGEITSLGSLVVALGIDLTLGALVGLGIQFGVAAEAIQIAAVLSFPKAPWAISSPMYHDTETYNEIMAKTFISRCNFDAGLFSEPMAIMNLLWDYSNAAKKDKFCWNNRVAASRLRHLAGTVESLRRRVAECLNVSDKSLRVEEPPYRMPHAKVSILRILQVWLFHDTMIAQTSKRNIKCADDGSVSIELNGPPLTPHHLSQVLNDKRHPYEVKNRGKILHQGLFVAGETYLADKVEYLRGFETRFISYALEHNVDLAFYFSGASIHLVVAKEQWAECDELQDTLCGTIPFDIAKKTYVQVTGGNRRGRRGRACGAWYPQPEDNEGGAGDLPTMRLLVFSSRQKKSKAQMFKKYVDKEILHKVAGINSILSCAMSEAGSKHSTKVNFAITSAGDCHEVSKIDLCDLFAAPDLTANASRVLSPPLITFASAKAGESDGSSRDRPLLQDVPEGARLLSVLASDRRRDNFIRFVHTRNDDDEDFNDDDDDDDGVERYIDVNLPKTFAVNGNRWKRKESNGMVYVPVNSVPSAATPTDDRLELYACCANTLDLRGGAIRAEGITMLPPGRLFLGLALLSVGINPQTSLAVDISMSEEEKKEALDADDVVQEIMQWICEKDTSPVARQARWRV